MNALHYRFTDEGIEVPGTGDTSFATYEQLRDIYEKSIVHKFWLEGRLVNTVFEQGKKVDTPL